VARRAARAGVSDGRATGVLGSHLALWFFALSLEDLAHCRGFAGRAGAHPQAGPGVACSWRWGVLVRRLVHDGPGLGRDAAQAGHGPSAAEPTSAR